MSRRRRDSPDAAPAPRRPTVCQSVRTVGLSGPSVAAAAPRPVNSARSPEARSASAGGALCPARGPDAAGAPRRGKPKNRVSLGGRPRWAVRAGSRCPGRRGRVGRGVLALSRGPGVRAAVSLLSRLSVCSDTRAERCQGVVAGLVAVQGRRGPRPAGGVAQARVGGSWGPELSAAIFPAGSSVKSCAGTSHVCRRKQSRFQTSDPGGSHWAPR